MFFDLFHCSDLVLILIWVDAAGSVLGASLLVGHPGGNCGAVRRDGEAALDFAVVGVDLEGVSGISPLDFAARARVGEATTPTARASSLLLCSRHRFDKVLRRSTWRRGSYLRRGFERHDSKNPMCRPIAPVQGGAL